MIAGGFVKGSYNNNLTEVVELVKTNSTPSFGGIPSKREDAVGGRFGDVPMLCGGYGYGSNYLEDCISFQDSEWILSHSMSMKRGYAAGVQLNYTTLWISGILQ